MKVRKKARYKKVYWLSAGLAVTAVSFVLLLYKPGRYDPPEVVPAGNEQREVSPYLTHELLPQLYNGAQLEEPFDLVITQEGINDIVARSKWPKRSDGISFSAPEVLFVPGSIVLMGTASFKGVGLVVTVVAEPRLDEEGLLNLRIAKVKVGAMNITFLARAIVKKMYLERLVAKDTDAVESKPPEATAAPSVRAPNGVDTGTQIAASLLNNEPFEPVFKVEDKKVRVKKITIMQGKLTVRLAPASD